MAPHIEYRWNDGSRFGADPQLVGAALDRLAKRLGRPLDGLLPSDLVEEAETNPRSPLRELFEWDDDRAALKYREEQARLILRSIRPCIISEGGERKVIGRVAVVVQDQRMYVPTDRAAKDEFMRVQMVEAAMSGLRGWRARYEQLAGFDEVLPLIDAAMDAMDRVAKASKNAKDRPVARATP